MAEMHQVAVLGGGSFGTVVANIVASNGHSTKLWLRNLELAEHINQTRENSEYLPGYHLAPSLEATNDLVQAVSSADIVFVAVPSQSFRQVARDIAPYIKPSAAAISTTKGLEPGDFRLMSQILAEELPMASGALSSLQLGSIASCVLLCAWSVSRSMPEIISRTIGPVSLNSITARSV